MAKKKKKLPSNSKTKTPTHLDEQNDVVFGSHQGGRGHDAQVHFQTIIAKVARSVDKQQRLLKIDEMVQSVKKKLESTMPNYRFVECEKIDDDDHFYIIDRDAYEETIRRRLYSKWQNDDKQRKKLIGSNASDDPKYVNFQKYSRWKLSKTGITDLVNIPESDIEMFEEYNEFCLWKKMKEFDDEKKSIKNAPPSVSRAVKNQKRKASDTSMDSLRTNPKKKKKNQSKTKETVIEIDDDIDVNLLGTSDTNKKKPPKKDCNDDSSQSSQESERTNYSTRDPRIKYDTRGMGTTLEEINEMNRRIIMDNLRKDKEAEEAKIENKLSKKETSRHKRLLNLQSNQENDDHNQDDGDSNVFDTGSDSDEVKVDSDDNDDDNEDDDEANDDNDDENNNGDDDDDDDQDGEYIPEKRYIEEEFSDESKEVTIIQPPIRTPPKLYVPRENNPDAVESCDKFIESLKGTDVLVKTNSHELVFEASHLAFRERFKDNTVVPDRPPEPLYAEDANLKVIKTSWTFGLLKRNLKVVSANVPGDGNCGPASFIACHNDNYGTNYCVRDETIGKMRKFMSYNFMKTLCDEDIYEWKRDQGMRHTLLSTAFEKPYTTWFIRDGENLFHAENNSNEILDEKFWFESEVHFIFMSFFLKKSLVIFQRKKQTTKDGKEKFLKSGTYNYIRFDKRFPNVLPYVYCNTQFSDPVSEFTVDLDNTYFFEHYTDKHYDALVRKRETVKNISDLPGDNNRAYTKIDKNDSFHVSNEDYDKVQKVYKEFSELLRDNITYRKKTSDRTDKVKKRNKKKKKKSKRT